jgi:tricorn protease
MKGLIVSVAMILSVGAAFAQPADRLLLQRPTLSRTQIVFVYGGDLWKCAAKGAANRLTAGPGVETSGLFPDGTVAFR